MAVRFDKAPEHTPHTIHSSHPVHTDNVMAAFESRAVKAATTFSVIFLAALYFLLIQAYSRLNIRTRLPQTTSQPHPSPGTAAEQKTPGEPITSFGDYAFLPPSLASSFPLPTEGRIQDYHEWNEKSTRELLVCMSMGTCGKNQRKVALLAAHWFEEAIVRDWRGGEGVWYAAIFLRKLGIRNNTLNLCA